MVVKNLFSCAFLATLILLTSTAKTDDLQPYQKLGQEIEADYSAYTQSLKTVYSSLKTSISKYAPKLKILLKSKPPERVKVGYQSLPKIVSQLSQSTELSETNIASQATDPPHSTSYSWKIARIFLNQEKARISEQTEKLSVLNQLRPPERRHILQKMIEEFPQLEQNQLLIDHHIQYNKFWQKAIAEDRERFDVLTRLHDAVVEIESLKERERLNGSNPVTQSRLEELRKFLKSETFGKMKLPKYASIKKEDPQTWVLEIPVYTDIKSDAFLKKFKHAVESIWSYTQTSSIKTDAPSPRFKLHIQIKHYNLGKKAPKPYTTVNLEKHVSQFPTDGAVLTTGAEATYAIMNRYIALGPQDITERMLAHEFGHILGFVDGYFRGYRDRGEDGFEILEIVPDNSDIMSNPSTGGVLLKHFERILESASEQGIQTHS